AARFWPEAERRKLGESGLKLLDEEGLQAVLGSQAQPEVSIMGTLTLEDRRYAVSGRIDRLAGIADRVVIRDDKTNR
ncbi:hypothetical protein ACC743_40005, partial [Rhizobium ruizarguesonis]